MPDLTSELACADCPKCDAGEDLTFYYSDRGFAGWRHEWEDERDPMHEPYRECGKLLAPLTESIRRKPRGFSPCGASPARSAGPSTR